MPDAEPFSEASERKFCLLVQAVGQYCYVSQGSLHKTDLHYHVFPFLTDNMVFTGWLSCKGVVNRGHVDKQSKTRSIGSSRKGKYGIHDVCGILLLAFQRAGW